PGMAEWVESRSEGPAWATGPVVDRRFGRVDPSVRRRVRRRLGLGSRDVAVLVVAGAWGVGHVEATAGILAASGRFVPVAVCGRDDALRRRLETSGTGIALGWVDDMAELMAASDALVENAGGLTAMEAFAAGLPVVTFRPIPGHGRENARRMAASGLSLLAADGDGLMSALDSVVGGGPLRGRMVEAGRELFSADPAQVVGALARLPRLRGEPAAGTPRPARELDAIAR
ncbi:MAG: glycosyltransferase, partial [Acidimicrobiales bacterium]